MTYTNSSFNHKRKRKNNFFDPLDFGPIIKDIFGSNVIDMVKNELVVSRPGANVFETKDNYRLELTVPGLGKKDISIKLEDRVLIVSANKESKLAEGEKVNRREYDFSKFKRSFNLPDSIDTTDIKAAFKNGILIIKLGKKEKSDSARNINID